MRKIAILLALLFLAACAGPFGMAGMKADELRELAKIKDASMTCVRGVYAGALVTITTINVDKGIPSGITVKDSCEVIFATTPVPKPPAPSP